MNLEKKLLDYLMVYCDETGDHISRVLERTSLNLLLGKYVEGTENAVKDYLELKLTAKKKNAVFLHEIQLFMEKCEHDHLRPVFLKGIFLTMYLNQKVDDKIPKDVDILIQKEDFVQYYKIFLAMGYTLVEGNALECQEMLKRRHLTFRKEIGEFVLFFEVHGSIINPPELFLDMTEEFLENVYRENLSAMKPYVFKIEYNIVYLMLHFYKHLPRNFHFLMFHEETFLKLLNVHDITCFIMKNAEEVDWTKVVEIVQRMRTAKYILFVSKWVNDIYGDVIPQSVLKELKKYVIDSKMYLMFQRGNGNFIFLFDYLVSKNLLSLCDLLRGELTNRNIRLYEIALEGHQSPVILLTKGVENERKFHVPNTSIALSYKIYMDTEKIRICYSVSGKRCAFYKGEGRLGSYDGIEFLVVKEKEVVHRQFTLTMDEDNVVVMSTNESVISNSDNLFKINNMSNDDMGYTLELEFGWGLLNVNFDEGNVAFNIAVLVGDSETAAIIYRYNIFPNDQRMNIWEMKRMVFLADGNVNLSCALSE